MTLSQKACFERGFEFLIKTKLKRTVLKGNQKVRKFKKHNLGQLYFGTLVLVLSLWG